jgi:hypothetical protein
MDSTRAKQDTTLSKLQQKKARIIERARALDKEMRARQNAMAKADRKLDTRRKIIVGAVMLARVKSGQLNHERFRQMLDEALTHPDQRALFDLLPKAEPHGSSAAVPGAPEAPSGDPGPASDRITA